MPQKSFVLGPLRGLSVGDHDTSRAVVVLHGREMCAADLAPFVEALQNEAFWLFPDAPLAAASGGRTWWEIDSEARIRAVEAGPLELSAMDPPGRAAARAQLGALLSALPAGQAVVLAGISLGGMLAMDYALHATAAKSRAPSAHALFSSPRNALAVWTPRGRQRAGRGVLAALGRDYRELASPRARRGATSRSAVARTSRGCRST